MRITPDSKFGQNHYPVLNGEIIRNAWDCDDTEGWVNIIVGYQCSGRPILEKRFGKVTFKNVFECETDPYEAFYA